MTLKPLTTVLALSLLGSVLTSCSNEAVSSNSPLGPVAGLPDNICRVTVTPNHEAETLLTRRDITKLTRGDIIDAPISTYITKGGVDDIKNTDNISGIYNQSKFFNESDKAKTSTKGYKWITNTYQTDDGVLAFIHSEYTGPDDHWGMPCMAIGKTTKCAPGTSKIGLAWMPNTANSTAAPRFNFLGHIAGFPADQLHFNVQGTPVYIVNKNGIDYFYILFSDKQALNIRPNIAMARSPVRNVLTAAKLGTTSVWQKYNNGKWVDSLSGNSTSILPDLTGVENRVKNEKVFVHSDALKHQESGAYFLSAYTLDTPQSQSSLVFYDSCDGENWRLNNITNHRDEEGRKEGWSYITLFDDDGSDNSKASGDFTMLTGYDYGGPQRHVMKFNVSVPESCKCP